MAWIKTENTANQTIVTASSGTSEDPMNDGWAFKLITNSGFLSTYILGYNGESISNLHSGVATSNAWEHHMGFMSETAIGTIFQNIKDETAIT